MTSHIGKYSTAANVLAKTTPAKLSRSEELPRASANLGSLPVGGSVAHCATAELQPPAQPRRAIGSTDVPPMPIVKINIRTQGATVLKQGEGIVLELIETPSTRLAWQVKWEGVPAPGMTSETLPNSGLCGDDDRVLRYTWTPEMLQGVDRTRVVIQAHLEGHGLRFPPHKFSFTL